MHTAYHYNLIESYDALTTCLHVYKYIPSHPYRSRLLPKARKDFTSLKPIVLWGYEGSPFVRPVREALGSLGLAHVMINCGRGSQNRDKLFAKTGR